MELNMQEEACPVALPVVTHRGSRYMVDLRLGQFRELAWPIRVVDFESAEGRELRWNLGIVPCPCCRDGYVAFNSSSDDGRVRCRRCGHLVSLG